MLGNVLPARQWEAVPVGCVFHYHMTTTPETQSAARQKTDCVRTLSCLQSLLGAEPDSDQEPDPMLAYNTTLPDLSFYTFISHTSIKFHNISKVKDTMHIKRVLGLQQILISGSQTESAHR